MPPKDTTQSWQDLATWEKPGTHLAVLGHPIEHSLSPAMHNAALLRMAERSPKFGDWHYWKFNIVPDRLAEALELFRAKRFVGINLTVPHKVLATSLVQSIDTSASEIGAVNTLRLTASGYAGYNTDGHGLITAIMEEFGIECRERDVVLLGAGGASRGAAIELLRRGCRTLWIGNRSANNLDEMLLLVRQTAERTPVRGFLFSEIPTEIPSGAVVINCTSAGLKTDSPPPITLSAFPRPAAVYDMIYNPACTGLLRDAAVLGIANANGLSMLVHQGARALELWTGEKAPIDVMREAALAGLASSHS